MAQTLPMEIAAFHAVWLRDNCPCVECRHPSGQRLLDSSRSPTTSRLADVEPGRRLVRRPFDDGHVGHVRPRSGCARTTEFVAQSHKVEHGCGTPRSPTRSPSSASTTSPPTTSRCGAGSRRSTGSASRSCATGRPTPARCRAWRSSSASSARRTTAGSSTSARSSARPTSPTPVSHSARTRQPVPRPDADAPAAPLLSLERGRRREHARRRFRVAADLDARPGGSTCSRGTPLRFRYRDDATELEAERPVMALDVARRRPGRALQHALGGTPRRAPTLAAPWYDAYRAFGARSRRRATDPLRARAGRPLRRRQPARPARPDGVLGGGRAPPAGLLRRPRRAAQHARGALAVSAVVDEIFRSSASAAQAPTSASRSRSPSTRSSRRSRRAGRGARDARRRALSRLRPPDPRPARGRGRARRRHGPRGRRARVPRPALLGPDGRRADPLHVAAKRYLCAVEPAYLEALSPASVLSLELQGGPFDEREVAAFEASPTRRTPRLRATTTPGRSRARRRRGSSTTGPPSKPRALSDTALALALGAAVLHAVWNLLLAGAREPEADDSGGAAGPRGSPRAGRSSGGGGSTRRAWPFLAASSVLSSRTSRSSRRRTGGPTSPVVSPPPRRAVLVGVSSSPARGRLHHAATTSALEVAVAYLDDPAGRARRCCSPHAIRGLTGARPRAAHSRLGVVLVAATRGRQDGVAQRGRS